MGVADGKAVNAGASKSRAETGLWLAQRLAAGVLAVAVVVHLGVIITAIQGGLSAAEIIGRLRGNTAWFAFYLVFAAAAAIHAPIGLRTILGEMTPLPPRLIGLLMAGFGLLLALMGWQAIYGLYAFRPLE